LTGYGPIDVTVPDHVNEERTCQSPPPNVVVNDACASDIRNFLRAIDVNDICDSP
jgi:hypothetical protein